MKADALLIPGLVILLSSASCSPVRSPEAAATVVLYNRNDPAAKSLADFYCSARGIDLSHEISVEAPLQEEISREEYDDLIARPVRDSFIRRGYWLVTLDMMNRPILYASTIRYVALIRGIPLKIRQCSDYPGDGKTQPDPYGGCNAASVDSELALLGLFSPQISGVMNNPLYRKSAHPSKDHEVPPAMLCVGRLDAPSDQAVREVILRGLEAEKSGLWGWVYLDLRSINEGSYALGDRWIRAAGDAMRSNGIPVLCDDLPETFQNGFPITDAAAYYGWYSQNIDGPFASESFRFLPGAVAFHLHSFSATTLRDPAKGWAGPLLLHGAAATIGNVYEPYLPFTTDLGVFATQLVEGHNLAESYYAAQPVLSWMSVLVGDPLYRPYARLSDPTASTVSSKWGDYHALILSHHGSVAEAATDLTRRAHQTGDSLYLEALGAALYAGGNFTGAMSAFQDASSLVNSPEVAFRLILEHARCLECLGRNKEGATLLKTALISCTESTRRALLASWIARIENPPHKTTDGISASPSPSFPFTP